ncbi:MAG: CatA-like O-acetyltransferase, partial [Candidatus Ornithospirochaeta sp.]|nr:CatA-like O-acetyltransferase [Candidatus Ornithospirochaeta sp.]
MYREIGKWKRRGIFHCFWKTAPTGYSLTAMIDDTHLCNAVKERKLRFFPAYIHITTRAINGIDEFMYGIRDGRLVLYD